MLCLYDLISLITDGSLLFQYASIMALFPARLSKKDLESIARSVGYEGNHISSLLTVDVEWRAAIYNFILGPSYTCHDCRQTDINIATYRVSCVGNYNKLTSCMFKLSNFEVISVCVFARKYYER